MRPFSNALLVYWYYADCLKSCKEDTMERFWTYDSSKSDGNTGSPFNENLMFSSMGVRPTRTLRKIYQKNPKAIICYVAAQYLGFTDVNILQKSMRWEFYNLVNFIHFPIRNYFLRTIEAFTRDMLRLSDQQTVWDSIIRLAETLSYCPQRHIQPGPEADYDDIVFTMSHFLDHMLDLFEGGMKMYLSCSQSLTASEKLMILKEGFNDHVYSFLEKKCRGTD